MSIAPSLRQKSAFLATVLVAVAGFALLVMMTLTVIDVTGRFLAGRPLTGANEIIRIALAVAVSCALPAVTYRGGHITLGLLTGPATHVLERLRGFLVLCFSAVVFTILAWLLWGAAMEAIEYKDVIGYLELPQAPMILVMAAMALASAIIVLIQAWDALNGRKLEPSDEESVS
ncbi:TRAP transporter small permease [Oceanibacterium hippocampi]|uniref:TRAP transporter small permease protein n=1 Tax=Oceanibacterium hippocampi TaxID=745714 RepID=A0A1Y5TYD4_9PROT|nr:TRAP transporter small permease [Oceanibacterium hippocampi]SLN76577.1 Tripartite ATP-independent periplasmic transporters, DctQ component [Oceanibacterium hippocampi]